MKIHELKTWPTFFDAIQEGRKKHELRKDDRGFSTGDVLHLREWDPDDDGGDYTEREIYALVTYVTQGPQFGLPVGHVVMSIVVVERTS